MAGGGTSCWNAVGRQRAFAEALQVVVGLGALSLSLGAWTALEPGDAEEGKPGGSQPLTQPGQLGLPLCVDLVLRAASTGGAIGLLRGVALVSVVWVAEILFRSKGLVTSVLRAPCLGFLVGLGLGAADGLGQTVELLGPGVWLNAVGRGVRGAGVGLRVAASSGVAIVGLLGLAATRAVKNVALGRKMGPAPHVIVLVAAGAIRMVLSLAPGCMAAGACVGCILGTDSRDFVGLWVLGLGWCAGWRWLGEDRDGVFVFMTGDTLVQPSPVIGGVVGSTGAVMVSMLLGLPLQVYPALVNILLGAAVTVLSWEAGEAVCQTLAKLLEEIFVAISINTYQGQEESLMDTFDWKEKPLNA